jgi:uncharacterized protein (TIGR03437 family)
MSRDRKILYAKLAAILSAVPMVIIGHSAGPDPRKTGGPGDSVCTECHLGSPINDGRGSVEISFPGGLFYSPGEAQVWTVTVRGDGQRTFGFQASARPASNDRNGQAGRFRALDASTFVLCEDGRLRPVNGACNVAAPLEFIEHSFPQDSGIFRFEWTPPATDIGPVNVYLAGNAANANGMETGDRIYTSQYTLQPRTLTFARPAIRAQQPVLQAFSGLPGLSSGTWLEIYGSDFSPITQEWAASDFNGNQAPTSLQGVRVNVNAKPAFVRYISPGQVNVQAPDDDATGDVQIEVINPAGTSNAVTVAKGRTSPALLTTPLFNVGGTQYVAALHTDFATFVGRPNLIAGVPFRPAVPGDTIIVFAVGCGATNPASPAGQFFPDARPLASPFQVTFGQTVATAQAVLAAQAIGLCQFNVTVPNVPDGDIRLDATVDGVATGQTLFTTVQR